MDIYALESQFDVGVYFDDNFDNKSNIVYILI